MSGRNFMEMLRAQWNKGNFVCVGLDSEHSKIPDSVKDHYYSVSNAVVAFNLAIVQATKDLVCAYKPNTAFYEAYGVEGITALQKTIADIHAIAPDVPVILDAKRGDIGNTNMGYVKFAFEYLQADAITVHPYLGGEALKPFLDQADKGVFVLCRTSNPGAGELQDTGRVYDGMPLYEYVAGRVALEWNKNGNCGLVVGATYPRELEEVRKIVGDMPILIPGVGAQGGDVEKTVKAGKGSHGQGMIINSSRGIIFASQGPNFAEAARHETATLRGMINMYL